jgi:hypothetical protein
VFCVFGHDHAGGESGVVAYGEVVLGFHELGAGVVDLRPCFGGCEGEFVWGDADGRAVFFVEGFNVLEEVPRGVGVGGE